MENTMDEIRLENSESGHIFTETGMFTSIMSVAPTQTKSMDSVSRVSMM